MSLQIALSGIDAVNTQLDSISNNIANSGTYGYKSSRVNFSAMYAGSQSTGVEASSTTQNIGLGGGVVTTGGAMDVAIQGAGFFVSHDDSGQTLYSRVGIFSTDKDGYVVNANGDRAQGYAAVPGSTTLGTFGDLQVPNGQIPAQASSTLNYVGNLSSDWVAPTDAVFSQADHQSYNSSTVSVVYDSLGAEHSVTQYFVKSAPNEVTVHYAMDGTDIAGTQTLQFGTDGQMTTPAAPVTVALGTPTDAAALSIAIDYTGTTQFSGETTNTANHANGFQSGTLDGVQIGADGSVLATYSNGEKQSVGTLAIATFADQGSLTAVSDTSWTASNASGNALYFTPGTGMAGTLTTGALEQSNVDITSELVNLMTAQRNYQANSKVISTESATLQALMQAL
ncbi:MAG TPA: flagellar hook-basal body complex protein [Burkholderiaceae bacterium]|jgi:flagellar hook protein FlgE